MNEYNECLVTVKDVVSELKILCDDYRAKNIDKNTAIKYLNIWREECGKNFIIENDFNPTVKSRIGVKRISIISNLLMLKKDKGVKGNDRYR